MWTKDMYTLYVSVPKAVYPDPEALEDVLDELRWCRRCGCTRELGKVWKYALLFQRDWNPEKGRYYRLDEIINVVEDDVLRGILADGEQIGWCAAEGVQRPRINGSSPWPASIGCG
jgi:hypothetical protein